MTIEEEATSDILAMFLEYSASKDKQSYEKKLDKDDVEQKINLRISKLAKDIREKNREDILKKLTETINESKNEERKKINEDEAHKYFKRLFGIFPKFEEHYQILIEKGVIVKQKNGYEWNRDKTSLCMYFSKIDELDYHLSVDERQLLTSLFNIGSLDDIYRKENVNNRHFIEIKEYLHLK